jgi:hypothetical protein
VPAGGRRPVVRSGRTREARRRPAVSHPGDECPLCDASIAAGKDAAARTSRARSALRAWGKAWHTCAREARRRSTSRHARSPVPARAHVRFDASRRRYRRWPALRGGTRDLRDVRVDCEWVDPRGSAKTAVADRGPGASSHAAASVRSPKATNRSGSFCRGASDGIQSRPSNGTFSSRKRPSRSSDGINKVERGEATVGYTPRFPGDISLQNEIRAERGRVFICARQFRGGA